MYASVAELRAEGVTEAQASDARLEALIQEASDYIDLETGWWFEPRSAEISLHGRGTSTLALPVPLIRLFSMRVDGVPVRADAETVSIVGAPILITPVEPSITWRGRVFSRGTSNVVLTGRFGYTAASTGSDEGVTPSAIRRATRALVIRLLPVQANVDAVAEARDRMRVVEVRTRDQAIRYAPMAIEQVRAATGVPEIEDVLRLFRRPAGLGAT